MPLVFAAEQVFRDVSETRDRLTFSSAGNADDTDFGANGLRALTGGLRAHCGRSEAAFLDQGQWLQEVVRTVGRVTAALATLSDIVDGPQGQTAAGRLREAALQVAGLSAGMSHEGEALVRLAGMVDGGSRAIEHLRRTIGEVAILGTNAKIQVAQLRGAHDDFTIFTREIERLAALATAGLDKLDEQHAALAALIAKAKRGQEAFVANHGQALIEVGQHLEQSLGLLEDHHRRAGALAVDAHQHSAGVARMINQAVASIQIGDITRQRVEHIEEALETAADLLEGAGNGRARRIDWATGLTEEEKRGLAGVICRLQSMQLVQAARQFDDEIGKLVASLAALDGETDELCRREAAIGQSSSGGRDSSFFATLRQEIENTRVLIGRYAAALAGTREVSRHISTTVGQMIQHIEAVRGIEADIRVMGLNATLKCSRLGDQGKSLAVIAQELRNCANKTQDQARSVESSLQTLIAEAQTMSGQASEGASGQGANLVIEAMAASLRDFEEMEGEFGAQLSSTRDDAGRARTLLADTASRSAIHQALGGQFRDAATLLTEMAKAAVPADGDIHALARQALSLLKGRYTMASEREIHALFADEPDRPAPPPAAPGNQPEASDDLADILF